LHLSVRAYLRMCDEALRWWSGRFDCSGVAMTFVWEMRSLGKCLAFGVAMFGWVASAYPQGGEATFGGDALKAAVLARIGSAVLSDDQPELRSFVFTNAETVFSNSNVEGEDLQAFQVTVAGQLTGSFDIGQVPLRVLRLEECGNDLGHYGLPDWYNETQSPPFILDPIRLDQAFSLAGFRLDLDPSQIAQLREFQDSGQMVGDTPILAYPALRALNERLAEVFASGGTAELYQIVDPSWGCGAGEIEVEIRSDPPLTAIHMIPDLYFSACEDSAADPWDMAQCRYWFPSPEIGMVSGIYAYQGLTADGQRKTGRINVDLRDTGDPLQRPVIVLR
jgi:hypothetical protein